MTFPLQSPPLFQSLNVQRRHRTFLTPFCLCGNYFLKYHFFGSEMTTDIYDTNPAIVAMEELHKLGRIVAISLIRMRSVVFIQFRGRFVELGSFAPTPFLLRCNMGLSAAASASHESRRLTADGLGERSVFSTLLRSRTNRRTSLRDFR